MREIKCRAWDKRNKQFVHFELFKGANNHTPKIYDGSDCEDWQQFTGLKDKNEKEIWEGDILSFDIMTPVGLMEGIGAMYWNMKRAQFGVEIKTELKSMPKEMEMRESEMGRPRIIGNIYENPELLKKQNGN